MEHASTIADHLLKGLKEGLIARIDIDVIRGACIGATMFQSITYDEFDALEERVTKLTVERA